MPTTRPAARHRITKPAKVSRFALVGDIDFAWMNKHMSLLHELCESGTKLVVADLSKVTFADSSLIGFLTRAHKHCTQHGSHLVVVHPQSSFRKVLATTNLDTVSKSSMRKRNSRAV